MTRYMRASRFVVVAALSSTLVGCQGGFSIPIWNPFAKSTANIQQPATPPFGPNVQEESWAKKIGDTVSSPFKSAGATPKKPSNDDPIALATKMTPPNAQLYVSLAKLQERSGNTDGAIEEYNKALDAEPKNVQAMLGLARLYDRKGRYDDALKLYRAAGELNPENAAIANDLGLCLARSGNVKESAGVLRKAVSLDPEKVLYRNNLATVLVELDRADEAFQTLTVAHGEAVAHYNVGYLLNKRDTEAAKAAAYQHFLAASKLNPNFREAQQWLASLKKYETGSASTGAPTTVAKVEDVITTPIATPVPRNDAPVPMLPSPNAAPPAVKPVTPYPTTSAPAVLPGLPLVSPGPSNVPAPAAAPIRPISQPTVVEPTVVPQNTTPRTDPPSVQLPSEAEGPQLNLNPQSRTAPPTASSPQAVAKSETRPSGPPAAVPPLPEQISSLGSVGAAASASTSADGKTERPVIKSAARYPASRY